MSEMITIEDQSVVIGDVVVVKNPSAHDIPSLLSTLEAVLCDIIDDNSVIVEDYEGCLWEVPISAITLF
jgi:hypothetical protein